MHHLHLWLSNKKVCYLFSLCFRIYDFKLENFPYLTTVPQFLISVHCIVACCIQWCAIHQVSHIRSIGRRRQSRSWWMRIWTNRLLKRLPWRLEIELQVELGLEGVHQNSWQSDISTLLVHQPDVSWFLTVFSTSQQVPEKDVESQGFPIRRQCVFWGLPFLIWWNHRVFSPWSWHNEPSWLSPPTWNPQSQGFNKTWRCPHKTT